MAVVFGSSLITTTRDSAAAGHAEITVSICSIPSCRQPAAGMGWGAARKGGARSSPSVPLRADTSIPAAMSPAHWAGVGAVAGLALSVLPGFD